MEQKQKDALWAQYTKQTHRLGRGAGVRTGEPVCAADTATMAGMLTSYSTPSSQLPRNQNTPNAHSNTP